MEDKRPVEKAFNAFKHMIDADMEITNGSLEVLERINHNAANKYMNLADSAKGLDEDRRFLENNNTEIKRYLRVLQDIDRDSLYLLDVVKELDEWSKELEIKCRHHKSM